MSKKFYLSLCLIFLLVFISTGCDKMKKSIDATARLAAQVNNLQKEVEKSYDDKLFSKDIALEITKIIKNALNPGVAAYTDFVEKLSKAYPKTSGEKPKASDWAIANALFKAIREPFQKILVIVGALTPAQSIYIALAIETLLDLLSVISGAFADAQHFIEGEDQWKTQSYRTS